MMCETHVTKDQILEVKQELAVDGWRLLATPATPTRRSQSGSSGGEFIAIRSHVAASGFDAMRELVHQQGHRD
eukprot:185047-Pyramimonas_sp.AAC.1